MDLVKPQFVDNYKVQLGIPQNLINRQSAA